MVTSRRPESLQKSAPSRTRAEDPVRLPTPADLLPASVGHVATGSAPPSADADWIESHLEAVEEAFRWTLETGRECGFLAYADREGGAPIPESMSRGTRTEISWRWAHADSTVAFTFHTHPGKRSIAIPSGMDVLGAIVRGDHVHYILDMHGRLVGWRFREPRDWPRACQEAMKNLSDARRLDRAFVSFLRESMEAVVPRFMEPCYGARLALADETLILSREAPRELVPRSMF